MQPKLRGRPPIDNGESERITLRVSKKRKRWYERAAAEAKMSLSAWIKRSLDKDCR